MTRKNNRNNTCYMCSLEATSREHVPPKCFFPKKKDLIGFPQEFIKDYRKNLITVPSCEAHNLSKSLDDQYLMIMFSLYPGINSNLRNIMVQKVARTFNYKPKTRSIILKDNSIIQLDGQPVVTTTAVYESVDNGLEKIAKAIYFSEYREKWTKNIDFDTPALIQLNHAQEYINRFNQVNNLSLSFLQDVQQKGSHPEIFSYKIKRDEDKNVFWLHMIFYQGLPVICHSFPENSYY